MFFVIFTSTFYKYSCSRFPVLLLWQLATTNIITSHSQLQESGDQ